MKKLNLIQKEYKKKLKKEKKTLIKLAKAYQPYDFGYIDNIVFQLIKMTYSWYSNKDLLIQDTTSDFNNYSEGLKALTRCKDIITIIENSSSILEEYNLRQELYQLIAEFSSC